MSKDTNQKIVLIGGGTGNFTILSVLKDKAKNISAIVSMADDGGSTGILRDQYGVLPPGDIRQCLVALSNSPREIRELFNFRFSQGDFQGHPFGNIFLGVMQQMTNDFDAAVMLASKVLDVQGNVIPVTLESVILEMTVDGGRTLRGESKMDQHGPERGNHARFRLDPPARINPRAEQAIRVADLIVIAPGDLYQSIIPNLLVKGVKEAIATSSAKLVYVCNLVNKPVLTCGYSVNDYCREVEKYLESDLDVVLYNNHHPPRPLVNRYLGQGETIVNFDRIEARPSQVWVGDDFISREIVIISPHDPLADSRGLIRHKAEKVVSYLMKLLGPSH